MTDSDDEEDFAEPLVDTTMLRRIASQNHYHVDLNNEREWDLPELLDRDYRKARHALLKDALSRLEEEPELLDKLREHMLQPTLLPVLTGAMKLEHEEEEQRQRKEYARFDMSLLDEAEGLPFRIVSSGTATSSSSISPKWNITRSSRREFQVTHHASTIPAICGYGHGLQGPGADVHQPQYELQRYFQGSDQQL